MRSRGRLGRSIIRLFLRLKPRPLLSCLDLLHSFGLNLSALRLRGLLHACSTRLRLCQLRAVPVFLRRSFRSQLTQCVLRYLKRAPKRLALAFELSHASFLPRSCPADRQLRGLPLARIVRRIRCSPPPFLVSCVARILELHHLLLHGARAHGFRPRCEPERRQRLAVRSLARGDVCNDACAGVPAQRISQQVRQLGLAICHEHGAAASGRCSPTRHDQLCDDLGEHREGRIDLAALLEPRPGCARLLCPLGAGQVDQMQLRSADELFAVWRHAELVQLQRKDCVRTGRVLVHGRRPNGPVGQARGEGIHGRAHIC
mmetsp:Transcript_21763/g.68376  ORF Transcript_21763/g.68376 Transcript_21763/m.68376 type:complete len:316 (-) Transcript_21763:673-1620(-)|eukprot:scaffold6339_cov112-Isochrysis_galbana.AAC.1